MIDELTLLFKRRNRTRILLAALLLTALICGPQNLFVLNAIGIIASIAAIWQGIQLFQISGYLKSNVWSSFKSQLTTVVDTDNSYQTPALHGVMGSIGDAQSLHVLAQGRQGAYDIRLLEQTVYYKPESKNGNYSRDFRVLEIKTSQDFYHVFMDAKRNSYNPLSSAMTVLAKSVKHNQQLTVEGDVNKYFNIYVPPDANYQSLITLSPDKLLAIRDYGNQFDIEFVGKSIYIISNNRLKKMKSVLIYQQSALELINAIGVNLAATHNDTSNDLKIVNPDVMTLW